jgi:hypothetical protein
MVSPRGLTEEWETWAAATNILMLQESELYGQYHAAGVIEAMKEYVNKQMNRGDVMRREQASLNDVSGI